MGRLRRVSGAQDLLDAFVLRLLGKELDRAKYQDFLSWKRLQAFLPDRLSRLGRLRAAFLLREGCLSRATSRPPRILVG